MNACRTRDTLNHIHITVTDHFPKKKECQRLKCLISNVPDHNALNDGCSLAIDEYCHQELAK